MGSAALIALIFMAFSLMPMLTSQDTSDDDDDMEGTKDIGEPDPMDPFEPVIPADPETLGTTFEATETGIAIKLGENETGSLAIITYVDTEDGDPFLDTHEARYYLVPEGTDWPDNTSETSNFIPGENDYGGSPYRYHL